MFVYTITPLLAVCQISRRPLRNTQSMFLPPMRKVVGWTPLPCLANRLSAQLARLNWNMRHIPIVSEAPFQPTPMKPDLATRGRLRLRALALQLRVSSRHRRASTSSSESAGLEFLSPFGLLLALLAEEFGRDNFAHSVPPFISAPPSAWLPPRGLRGESLYA